MKYTLGLSGYIIYRLIKVFKSAQTRWKFTGIYPGYFKEYSVCLKKWQLEDVKA